MSSVKSESLTSLPIQMPFISFCCLIAEARTSSIMLNNSCESEYPCHVPDLRGKALNSSPLRIILEVAFRRWLLRCRGKYPLRVLIRNGCCILSNAFSASIERILWFLFFSLVDMFCHIDCFTSIEPALHPRDKSHLVMVNNLLNVLLDPIG